MDDPTYLLLKIPKSMLDVLTEKAASQGKSIQEFVIDLWNQSLSQASEVPPESRSMPPDLLNDSSC